MTTRDTLADTPLPLEGSSTSELLSLTHVLTIEIVAADKTAWSRAADRLEHRKVDLTVKLLNVWKGSLLQAEGATFQVEIEQRRIGEGMVMGFLGLWSHVVPEPDVGVGYLVMASASPDVAADAASLMREGPLQRLFSPDSAADIPLAKQGERIYQETLHARDRDGSQAPTGSNDPEVEAARALLAHAAAHRAEAGDLFGRYLWARILQTFARSPARPFREALDLMTAPDATLGLRGECLSAFERLMPELAGDRDLLLELGRAFVALLLDPGAALFGQAVVTVSLFYLVFPDGVDARFPAATLLHDAAVRAQVKQSVEQVPGPRSAKLASWLAG